MATVRNPTSFPLFSRPILRVIEPGEVVDGLTDEQAEAVCHSGVFERGMVVSEPEAEAMEAAPEPTRPAGRRGSVRGAVEVEETTEDEIETR